MIARELPVFVRRLGGEEVASLPMPSTATIGDVKRHIQGITTISFFRQQLVLGTELLENGTALAELLAPLVLTLVELPHDPAMDPLLLEAVETWDVAAAKDALRRGADPDYADADGSTALLSASVYRFPEMMELLCTAGADRDRGGFNGQSAIHIASLYGHVENVSVLCRARANLDQVDKAGVTPLLIAARSGAVEVARFLVEAKANVNHADTDGATPLSVAVTEGHSAIADLLRAQIHHRRAPQYWDLPHNPELDPVLLEAVEIWDVEAAEGALRGGADPDFTDASGWTPLTSAAVYRFPDMIELLCEAGADRNRHGVDGQAPLHLAALYGHVTNARALLEARANLNRGDKDGATPLSIAARSGAVEVARFLVEARADSNQARADGSTPLSIAVNEGHTAVSALFRARQQPTHPPMHLQCNMDCKP